MTNPVIFRTHIVIFKTNPIIFRKNPVIFMMNHHFSKRGEGGLYSEPLFFYIFFKNFP